MVVADQVQFAMRDDEPQAAEFHMRVVQQLVRQTNGTSHYRSYPFAIITFADARRAGESLTRQLLPFNVLKSGVVVDDIVREQAHMLTRTLLGRMTPNRCDSGQLCGTISDIHQLVVLFDTSTANEVVMRTIGSAVLYTLVNTAGDIACKPQSHVSLSDILLMAAQLLGYAFFRHFVPTTGMQVAVLRWLSRTLQQDGNRVAHWRSDIGLDSLLWLLCVASTCAKAAATEDRNFAFDWFHKELAHVQQQLCPEERDTCLESMEYFQDSVTDISNGPRCWVNACA